MLLQQMLAGAFARMGSWLRAGVQHKQGRGLLSESSSLRGQRDSSLAAAQEIHQECPSVLLAVRMGYQGEDSAQPLWGPVDRAGSEKTTGRRWSIPAGQCCSICHLLGQGWGGAVSSNADLASGGLGWAWESAFWKAPRSCCCCCLSTELASVSRQGTKPKEMGQGMSHSPEREPAGRRWAELAAGKRAEVWFRKELLFGRLVSK